jgi:hypothetical protein
MLVELERIPGIRESTNYCARLPAKIRTALRVGDLGHTIEPKSCHTLGWMRSAGRGVDPACSPRVCVGLNLGA